jgi:hypothetical protein
MADEDFGTIAGEYERAAGELERAAQHLRITARHFRDREIPRACAHAWAAQGQMWQAQEKLRVLAELHAGRAQVE